MAAQAEWRKDPYPVSQVWRLWEDEVGPPVASIMLSPEWGWHYWHPYLEEDDWVPVPIELEGATIETMQAWVLSLWRMSA